MADPGSEAAEHPPEGLDQMGVLPAAGPRSVHSDQSDEQFGCIDSIRSM